MRNFSIVYFSMKGQTIGPGMKIRVQEVGNTALAAGYIHDALGGSMFELVPDKEYSSDHMELIKEAKEELRAGRRVPLRGLPDFDGVDTVILGYPNWWGHLPMPVVTFLESRRWDGMRIMPFCSNEGSGLSDTVDDIRKYADGAEVMPGLAVTGSRTELHKDAIIAWARKGLEESL
ncbi:MAG: flavodoxin [Oscillospiraceae bacterium]